jgi:hypothetical protein
VQLSVHTARIPAEQQHWYDVCITTVTLHNTLPQSEAVHHIQRLHVCKVRQGMSVCGWRLNAPLSGIHTVGVAQQSHHAIANVALGHAGGVSTLQLLHTLQEQA